MVMQPKNEVLDASPYGHPRSQQKSSCSAVYYKLLKGVVRCSATRGALQRTTKRRDRYGENEFER